MKRDDVRSRSTAQQKHYVCARHCSPLRAQWQLTHFQTGITMCSHTGLYLTVQESRIKVLSYMETIQNTLLCKLVIVLYNKREIWKISKGNEPLKWRRNEVALNVLLQDGMMVIRKCVHIQLHTNQEALQIHRNSRQQATKKVDIVNSPHSNLDIIAIWFIAARLHYMTQNARS